MEVEKIGISNNSVRLMNTSKVYNSMNNNSNLFRVFDQTPIEKANKN